MWSNRTSIAVVVERTLRFKPPYCANASCAWHEPEVAKREARFTRYGTRPIARYPYLTARFRCARCFKVFSSSFFALSYRDKTDPTYEQIFDLLNDGYSRRAAARQLKTSLDTVLRRFKKMARQGLLLQARVARNVKIRESIAFDGLENFSFSQFDPNNINHAVGRDSYFTYDFNFTPLNRKGRMSERQRAKEAALQLKHGRYSGRGIRESSRRVFERLLERAGTELVLHTDNHYAYQEALKRIEKQNSITHLITPAKAARNFRNRLFAINHLDLLTRQRLAPFKRETISFSKHSIGMIQSFSLFMVQKNFMRPIFSKPHQRDPSVNVMSPAMRLGLTKKILTFHEFFSVRVTKAQVSLNEDWERFVDFVDPTSRRKIAPYTGA